MRQIFGLMLSCFLLFVGLWTSAYAENLQPNAPMFHKHQAVDWAQKLKLSEVQKTQLQAIYAESRPQLDAIKQQMATLRQQMENIRAADEKKIRAILDEKQAAKFDKMQVRFAKQNRPPQPRDERRHRFKMRENNI